MRQFAELNLLPHPVELLGIPLHPWTMKQTVEAVRTRMAAGVMTVHGCLNAAKITALRKHEGLRLALQDVDVMTADGASLLLAGRLLGSRIPERVTGIDLFFQLAAVAESEAWPVFLLGAKPGVIEAAARELMRRHPRLQIAGKQHGYFGDREESVVEQIHESGAWLLFVALGTPRQECFIHRWRSRLGVMFAMGVGGSFDVLAGHTSRAPAWVQQIGFEWLYRLIQEPRRLWKRYAVANAIFLWMLIRAKWNPTLTDSR